MVVHHTGIRRDRQQACGPSAVTGRRSTLCRKEDRQTIGSCRQRAEIAPCSLKDTDALTETLSGADSASVMIPPSDSAPDFRAYQNAIGASVAEA
jgi:hypothetical protein